MNISTSDKPADALRAAMVERILAGQRLTPAVEQVLRRIERHRYVPESPLNVAYDAEAVITHTFPDGTSLSCASHPDIVATMLDMLDVQPGNKILEIGAGTGYNAALVRTLAGPTGAVTTLDINPDVTAAARRHLDDTGFLDVTVLTRDGAQGAPEHAPYDRIIVTVGAWDVSRTWWDQLLPGGRLVLPLRWRGTTRAVSFVKHTDRWESERMTLCGFVPMLGQDGERSITIDPDNMITIYYDIDQPIDLGALQGALTRDKSVMWSDATIGGEESFDRVWLHLSTTHDGTVRIQADQKAVETDLCTPAIPVRTPALVDGDSLAYLTTRRGDGSGQWQLGAIGHGPRGRRLVEHIVGQIQAWDADRLADPTLTVYPGATAPAGLSGRMITKPSAQILLRYQP